VGLLSGGVSENGGEGGVLGKSEDGAEDDMAIHLGEPDAIGWSHEEEVWGEGELGVEVEVEEEVNLLRLLDREVV
jgi:hypothetical protein